MILWIEIGKNNILSNDVWLKSGENFEIMCKIFYLCECLVKNMSYNLKKKDENGLLQHRIWMWKKFLLMNNSCSSRTDVLFHPTTLEDRLTAFILSIRALHQRDSFVYVSIFTHIKKVNSYS